MQLNPFVTLNQLYAYSITHIIAKLLMCTITDDCNKKLYNECHITVFKVQHNMDSSREMLISVEKNENFVACPLILQ